MGEPNHALTHEEIQEWYQKSLSEFVNVLFDGSLTDEHMQSFSLVANIYQGSIAGHNSNTMSAAGIRQTEFNRMMTEHCKTVESQIDEQTRTLERIADALETIARK